MVAANTFYVVRNNSKMKRWQPLVNAFSKHSYVGLNITTTDIYGVTHFIAPKDEGVYSDTPTYISDGLIIYSSGRSQKTDMSMITDKDRYVYPHTYAIKEDN